MDIIIVPELPKDIFYNIGLFIDNGKDWVNYICSSKLIYTYTLGYHEEKRDRFSNHILALFSLLPNVSWDIDALSGNIGIPLPILLQLIPRIKSSYYICSNKNVPIDMIFSTGFDKIRSIYGLSNNPNFSWDMIRSNESLLLDRTIISSRGIITVEIVKKYPEFNWDYPGLSSNRNLTWDFITQNLDKAWNWNEISRHKCITPEIVRNNLDKPWNNAFVLENPNFDWEELSDLFFQGHITASKLTQDYVNHLSNNIYLTIDILRNNRDIPWNWSNLSRNRAFDWKDLQDNRDLPWEIHYFSENINLTSTIVISNLHLNWNWNGISGNIFKMVRE